MVLGVKIISTAGACGHLVFGVYQGFFRRIAGCTTVLNFTLYNLCMCFKNHNQQNSKVYSYHSTCLVLLRMLEKSGSPWMDLS